VTVVNVVKVMQLANPVDDNYWAKGVMVVTGVTLRSYPKLASSVLILVVEALRRRMWWGLRTS